MPCNFQKSPLFWLASFCVWSSAIGGKPCFHLAPSNRVLNDEWRTLLWYIDFKWTLRGKLPSNMLLLLSLTFWPHNTKIFHLLNSSKYSSSGADLQKNPGGGQIWNEVRIYDIWRAKRAEKFFGPPPGRVWPPPGKVFRGWPGGGQFWFNITSLTVYGEILTSLF